MKVSAETKIQIQFIDYCTENYPNLIVYHIPNEGKRGLYNGMILKRMGLIAGMPDIHIPSLRLWIEFKTDKGKISENQNRVLKKLAESNDNVYVLRTLKKAIEVLNFHLNQENMFKIKVRVLKVQPTESGISASGKEWKKRAVIVETLDDQYAKTMKLDTWGDVTSVLDSCSQGEHIICHISCESREWNDKWFSDLKAFKIEKDTNQNYSTEEYQKQQKPVSSTNSAPANPVPAEQEIDDDLPF
jgi:hypothetical protein